MTNREKLIELKRLSTQLDKIDYNEIYQILKQIRIPIPIARLPPNTGIDRVRKNIGEELFTNVDEELSYIKDPNVIDKFLTEFGRANEPHQPMFYGATESTLIANQRITAIAETSELFQNPDAVNFDGELYTVSRWKNSSELFVAEMVFSQGAIDINPDIKKSFEKQSELAKKEGADDLEFYLDFLVFVSDQFAKPKASHHDYKISTAYTNLVLSHPDIQGVAYPSVQTHYYGQNIVFPPYIVDKYFVVDVLAMQRLYKNRLRSYLNNVKNCLNPKDCLTNIVWSDLELKYIRPIDEIHKYLDGND